MNDKNSASSFKFSPFFILPLLAGLILIGSTVFWIESDWIKAAVILLVSVLLGVKLELQRAQNEPEKISIEEEEEVNSSEHTEQQMLKLSEIINHVIEISNRQIENSRIQTEEAITEMSGRFTSLVSRLNSALDAATLSNVAVPTDDGSSATLLDSVFNNLLQRLNLLYP